MNDLNEEEEEKKENDVDNNENNKNIQVDASMGYIDQKHKAQKGDKSVPTKGRGGYVDDGKTIINKSIYFKQFKLWIRYIFDDDELFYRYLLLFILFTERCQK